jgi:hypothetical protein
MAKLKMPKAGKVGHGNTPVRKGLDLLAGRSQLHRLQGSGAPAKVHGHTVTLHAERALHAKNRRGSGG